MQQAIENFVNEMAAIGEKNTYNQQWFKDLPADRQEAIRRRDTDTARSGADRLVQAIQARDIATLEQRLHSGNMTSRKLFTAITGVPLGSTNKSGSEGIRQFIGAAEYDAFQREQEAAVAARKASEKAAEEERAASEVLDQKVQYSIDDGPRKVGTRRQWIDDLVAAGYKPEDAKRGFATVVRMVKDGRYFTIRSKAEMQYARKLAA